MTASRTGQACLAARPLKLEQPTIIRDLLVEQFDEWWNRTQARACGQPVESRDDIKHVNELIQLLNKIDDGAGDLRELVNRCPGLLHKHAREALAKLMLKSSLEAIQHVRHQLA